MTPYRVIVCGGRDYADRDRMHQVLGSLYGWCLSQGLALVVIEGQATGADQLASEWAVSHGVANERWRAAWNTYGNRAGPLRNTQMVAAGVALCLAFPGGHGTSDCRAKAMRAGARVVDC